MNAPLSIGIVCYPSLGGSGIVASELAAGLAERGHRVHLIASAPPSRKLPEHERLTFHEISISDYPLFEHAPYALAAASSIVEVTNEHALDVINVHYAVPHSSSAYLARRVLGRRAPRVITTLHGTDVTRPAYQTITRFTVGCSDGITAPSRYLAGEAHRLLGLDAAPPIEVIPNFVDTDRFAPPASRDRRRLLELFEDSREPEGPVLFHVSNFRPVKRAGDLLEMLARMRKQIPARLVLVGDGPDRARAAQRAQELGLSRSVCFLGKRTDFVEHLKHADVFVLSSETESFGVAALEALSAGVPVAAYRVGGLGEVVDETCGRLVAPLDTGALADAAIELATNEDVRKAARARAVAHFRREPAIDRWEEFYRRIVAAPAREEHT